MKQEEERANTASCVCCWLVVLVVLGGIGTLITFLVRHDFGQISDLREKYLAEQPLIQTISIVYDQYIGEQLLNGLQSEADDMAYFQNRMIYFLAMLLADEYTALVKDVTSGNGECNLICNQFDIKYYSAVGNLYNKSYQVMADNMVQIRRQTREVLARIVRTIQKNPKLLESAKWLGAYADTLEPVRTLFLFE